MLEKIDKVLGRTWTPEKIEKYVGNYKKCYLSYAVDSDIRENAASGGTITAILANEFKTGNIDGALVLTSFVEKGEFQTKFIIAQDEKILREAQGSKYISVRFSSHAIPLIKEFKGRLALVLLPCDTLMIKRMREKDPELDEKIKLVLTLFCGHMSEEGLTQMVVNKLRPDGKPLTSYRHRMGHWRGNLAASFEDTPPIVKPFSFFSDYQNLYYFCEKKCLHCIDQTGYDADISVGDIWSMAMKKDPIKHNAVIVRTDSGEKAFQNAVNQHAIVPEEVPVETICDGQSRSLPLHYNISARSRVGKLFKEPIRDTIQEKTRLIDIILAFFLVWNYSFSHSPLGRALIPRLPRFVIKTYLYFIKGLEVL